MTEKVCYIHYGKGSGPRLTQRADKTKEKLLPHHVHGLSYTATGYGNKIPTIYTVFVGGRWRRVYSRCYSNASSNYIIVSGDEIPVSLH